MTPSFFTTDTIGINKMLEKEIKGSERSNFSDGEEVLEGTLMEDLMIEEEEE